MKISLDLEPCCNNRSGIGIYTYNIAKALTKINKIDLHGEVFSFLGRNKIDKNYSDLNIKVNVCRLFPYGVYRRIWDKVHLKYNTILNSKSEIYHFFDYIVPPNIEGKVITTIHDMTYVLYPEIVEQKTMNRIKKGIEYSINRADKIITVSESSKNDIVKYLNVPENKIDVVYNGVEYNKFAKSYNEEDNLRIREKYKLPKNYILYMGTLEPRKNIESIVEAFKLFNEKSDLKEKNFKLVIAGKKGWLFESIFNLVETLKLQDDVIFTDYIDEVDKPIIYQMARLFVFPSIYEGFGIPVLEAMAASVPVITSNVSSLPEVAGDAAILVEPKDVKSIAENMHKILSDNDLRDKLICKGHIQAKKFTWEASAEKLYKIYKSMM